MIGHFQHFERADIDQRMQALDRMSIVVVKREHPHPNEAVEHTASLLDGMAEVADCPGIDGHELEFFQQPAPAQRFLKAHIGLNRFLDLEDFLDRDHCAGILAKDFGQECPVGEIDLAGDNAHDAAAVDVEPGHALDRRTLDIGAHEVFGWFRQIYGLHAEILTPAVMVADELRRAAEFGGR